MPAFLVPDHTIKIRNHVWLKHPASVRVTGSMNPLNDNLGDLRFQITLLPGDGIGVDVTFAVEAGIWRPRWNVFWIIRTTGHGRKSHHRANDR